MRDRTEALLHIAIAVAANYRREKLERGLLDYDDLIDKTLALLASGASAWVHYKLDRGVDHVLIDEAQDTSPRQWDIIAHIISEFTTGAGARDGMMRTVFAVGDEKQSIFSFQGAAPREFDARRWELKKKFEDAELKFESIPFTYSFRSGQAILKSVDHVFRDEAIYRSIHAEKAYPLHEALPDAGPSQIDLWELSVADDKQDIEGWRAPFDGVPVTSAEVKLSKRIQTEIRRLVTGGTMTGRLGNRRRLTYGDVLVLVRRRGNLFDAVIQALKHAGVPVAGADRLKLTEHIAIIDLMNLADALLLPQDDLALAVALKSPLFNLTEDELFTLAWNRKGSLRDALTAHAAESGRFRDALDRLAECERRFRTETPFAFYAWLLGGDDGRARILRRLGHEANDALDEFLELALSYERKAPASLQGFMAWLRAADTEVKRDMEISRDEVRVMTVHGAKGLEAPVVIMADTTTSPSDTQRLRLIHLPQGNGRQGRGLGRTQGGRSAWRGQRAQRDAGGDRARISPPALCGDDARGRSADHRRLHARQQEQRPRAFLVRSGQARPCEFRPGSPGNPGWRRRREKLQAGGRRDARDRHCPRCCGSASIRRCRNGCIPRPRRSKSSTAGCARPIPPPTRAIPSAPANRSSCAPAPCSAARWCTGCCNRCPMSRPKAAAMRRCVISPATPATGPRPTARRWRRTMLALIADPRFARGVCARQPGRGLDRRTAGAAGTAARAGFGADRPAGGDPSRGPDRRLQDQPRPAGRRGRGARGLCPPARALPGGAAESFIPSCRSAPRCFGPKPLN